MVLMEQEKKLTWHQLHPDKVAKYAREAYHKRIAADPEYRKVLAERTRLREQKMREARKEQGIEPKVRQKKEKPPPKPTGRPRKYDIEEKAPQ
jgi:hypothetical protein